jgi:hypothetical protein
MSLTRAALAVLFFAAGCVPLGLQRPGTEDAPEIVNVELTDSSIDVWPRLVARGKVGLDIVNDGQLEHGLHIVGPGVDEQTDEFLVTGQRRRIWLKLAPGTFRVECPDGDHAARGMVSTLVVADQVSWFRR